MDTIQKQIVSHIKLILKRRKQTYKDLAEGTGISESSIKKILSGGDCSFARLVEIINFLEMNFVDFIDSMSFESKEPFFSLTLEQENFFAQNLSYYLFFHKLFREHKSVEDIQKTFSIDEKGTWKILRKLEEFSLIEITSYPEVKILVKGGLNFLKEGPLQGVLMSDAVGAFTHHLVHSPLVKKPVDSPFIRFYFAKTSKETFNKYVQELRDLHEDFAQRALKDRRFMKDEDLIDVTWLLGLSHCHGLDLTFKYSGSKTM